MTFSPALEQRFDQMLKAYPEGKTRSAVVPMLIYAQDETGAVTEDLILGKFHVQVCTNISCMLVGGTELYEHCSKKLGIGHKQTTPDGLFSLEEVECMGACSWAPAVEINYDFHHNVTPEMLDKLLDDIRKANK
jgi:NADH-quinone oxidoreductase subunit E